MGETLYRTARNQVDNNHLSDVAEDVDKAINRHIKENGDSEHVFNIKIESNKKHNRKLVSIKAQKRPRYYPKLSRQIGVPIGADLNPDWEKLNEAVKSLVMGIDKNNRSYGMLYVKLHLTMNYDSGMYTIYSDFYEKPKEIKSSK